jgi:hypothetical protein
MKTLVTSLTIITSCLVFGYYFLFDPTQFEKAKYETQTENIYAGVDEEVTQDEIVENEEPRKQYSEVVEEPTKQHSNETHEYFNEIALKNEFTGDRESLFTWTTDMKIYVDGEKPEYLMFELKRIVSELNDIINPINIKITPNKNESNYIIYFGSHTDFKNKYKLYTPQHLNRNWGYFEVNTNSGLMYIDLYRNKDTESHKHLLREELTQSLGLFNDSYKYPESIFYQDWTTTTEFAPIDIELIEMLYN